MSRFHEAPPVRIESSATLNADYFTGLVRWRQLAGKKVGPAHLVYGGDTLVTRADTRLVPWRRIGELWE
jgi:hypothetical protein